MIYCKKMVPICKQNKIFIILFLEKVDENEYIQIKVVVIIWLPYYNVQTKTKYVVKW